MTTYLVQMNSVWEDKPASLAKARQLIAGAKPTPGSLIVLPEMFATGFSIETKITAEPEQGTTEQFLIEMAREHRCAVIGGLVAQDATGDCRNQSLFITPEGEVLGRYSKNQPFSLGGESTVHTAGKGVTVIEWQGLKIALLICYDLRFPELAREAVKAGAELLVFIAAWPIKRVQHWITLLQARAIENLAFVIGVNQCGTDPSFNYPGRSLVVDPHGVIIADAGDHEHVLRSEIDPAILRTWRSQFPALRDAGIHS
ncbi:MAG: carbon-nitrogen family hydrolase [Verrucomicrobiaceae bacterium]|nr:carbon-nitrogen family hydrolase [Verrucomicrobiaceae bacterium]